MTMRTLANVIVGLAWPATWKVYDLDHVPEKLSTAKLPMLVFTEGADGGPGEFKALTFGAARFQSTYPGLTHWLVWKPTALGIQGKSPIVGQMIDLLDTYLSIARTAFPKAGGTIMLPKLVLGKLTILPEGEPPPAGSGVIDYYARPFIWTLSETL